MRFSTFPSAGAPDTIEADGGAMGERAISVLTVDDDRKTLDMYAHALTQAAYRCIKSTGGHEALDRLAGDSVDVVVSDLSMPGMSGLEFIRRVRERDPDLPILVVTGEPAIGSAIESIDAGVFRYLTKPLSPSALVRAVSDAVHSRALAIARRAAHAQLAGSRAAPTAELVQKAVDACWLAVQPIVAPGTRRVVAYEAFFRTRELGFRDPQGLFEAAEKLDLLPQVGRAVRARAGDLIGLLPASTDLFVNLHARDLLDDQLFSSTNPLHASAHRVVLELSERRSLEDIPDARARIEELKIAGYRVALDDMGAGYAGLATFAMLKPSFVKIDTSLVRDVDSEPMKQTLIKSMLGLSRELGIEGIAEGVETKAEAQALAALGCTLFQGYAFGRPGAPFPAVTW
jgi:EAL domain-containing protein (putative c-di-GMP-specific phosphodiesterase class I)